MLLFYVRHGDPTYDKQDNLTAKGFEQVNALAKRFAVNGLDELYVSPMNRARQSVAPTEQILGKSATVIDWLSEGYAWENTTICENGVTTWLYQNERCKKLFVTDEIYKLGNEWYRHPAFAEGNYQQGVVGMRNYVTEFLHGLGYDYDANKHVYTTSNVNDNRRIGIFAHEGVGMLFLSTVLDIPYPMFVSRFYNGHSGVTVIEFSPDKAEVIPHALQVSNDSHLYKEGLPTDYQNRVLI